MSSYKQLTVILINSFVKINLKKNNKHHYFAFYKYYKFYGYTQGIKTQVSIRNQYFVNTFDNTYLPISFVRINVLFKNPAKQVLQFTMYYQTVSKNLKQKMKL